MSRPALCFRVEERRFLEHYGVDVFDGAGRLLDLAQRHDQGVYELLEVILTPVGTLQSPYDSLVSSRSKVLYRIMSVENLAKSDHL